MEQDQLTNMCRVSYFCRHFKRAMPKSLPVILIIIKRILSIVYEQVGPFNKIKEARFAYFSPFYISGKNKALTYSFTMLNIRTMIIMITGKDLGTVLSKWRQK